MDAKSDKKTIIRVRHPNGTWSAQEAIVRLIVGDELNVSLVPGTERLLPLSENEAQEWVSNFLNEETPLVREELVKTLCSTGVPLDCPGWKEETGS